MMALPIILIFIILAAAFPAGYLLAYLCRDELQNGRKWFRGISWAALIVIIILLFFYKSVEIILTLAFIAIVSLISVHKSSDKKWTR